MKRRLAPIIAAIGAILLIITGFIGAYFIIKYLPSNEMADKQQLLQVQGEQTAIYFNSELQESKAITRDGQTYLPITWVNENINERFYWDDIEKLLVYTLPETIVYADKRTTGSTGAPLLLVEDTDVYLSLGLISNYTDVQVKAYENDGVNRAFIDNTWGEWTLATSKKETEARVKGGIKSPIITTIPKGAELRILEQLDDWSRVETSDGYIGYMENRFIGNIRQVPQISMFETPVYTNISLDEKVSLAFHQVMSDDANDAMETLIANTKGVNVIAPTWFALTDNKGNYHSYGSREYVDKAHAMGMQVWGVLDNFNKGDDVNSGILFAQTSVRKDLISNLMAEVESLGLDGINLDIEGIKPSAGPHYVQFIRELSIECRKNGIILSVDNYVPTDYTSFYNRAEQGRVADYVIIMGYDEHYAGGDAGSVASLPYVKKGIEDTCSIVPKEKVINAIPLYTRVWTDNNGKISSSALGIAAAKAWVEEKQVDLYWQEEMGQYYGELQTDEGLKMVWMEEEKSIGLKMDAIKDAELAGVAVWKLGFEPADIWDVVKVNE
ncbi:MAG: SH3 domain-containing protein [Hungatella hathewayi]|nr:SH3 domain-containing protein [Hungatella hathewayi]